MADRHKPEDTPVTLRPPQELRAWLLSESARRGISRSALIIEALTEKRDREAVHAASLDAKCSSSRIPTHSV